MRILIWHGYLLGGTGSNVYTRALARAWSLAGHDVVVLCQDPEPERFDLGSAIAVRPELSGPLPVFVLDRYGDAHVQLLTDMSQEDRQRFVDDNVAAIEAQGPADLLFANHVLLGGPVGAASGLRYVVKAHGSELEFAMRGRDDLCRWATETMEAATAIVAGSEHVAGVLDELARPDRSKVHVVPPGVDVDALRPADRGEALAALIEQARDDPPNAPDDHDARLPDAGNAERLAAFFAVDRKTVLYVGKLSPEKGVSLLIDAIADLDARCVVVGFGPSRAQLEASAGDDVLFTGPLEHRHLVHLWPLADVSVVPSVFPEAFGMVAAEAASCGSPPLVARHSGLAEVAAAIDAEYPTELRHLAAFERGDVDDLRRKLKQLLELPSDDWLALSSAARRVVERQWSWTGIAERILDLA